jgi:hypothetical protein
LKSDSNVVANDELFNFHSTRVIMNELVRAHMRAATRCQYQYVSLFTCAVAPWVQVNSLIECDILLWGGDTRWLVAVRMAGGSIGANLFFYCNPLCGRALWWAGFDSCIATVPSINQ